MNYELDDYTIEKTIYEMYWEYIKIEENTTQYKKEKRSKRENLILDNLNSVLWTINKYKGVITSTNNILDLNDLIQIGMVSLIKAIDYNNGKEIPKAKYLNIIENDMINYIQKFRKDNPVSNTSLDNLKDCYLDFGDLIGDYFFQDIKLTYNNNSEILNKIIKKDKINYLHKELDLLSSNENLVIQLRFGLNNNIIHTQQEIANILNFSRSHISRLEKSALKKLKNKMILK